MSASSGRPSYFSSSSGQGSPALIGSTQQSNNVFPSPQNRTYSAHSGGGHHGGSSGHPGGGFHGGHGGYGRHGGHGGGYHGGYGGYGGRPGWWDMSGVSYWPRYQPVYYYDDGYDWANPWPGVTECSTIRQPDGSTIRVCSNGPTPPVVVAQPEQPPQPSFWDVLAAWWNPS